MVVKDGKFGPYVTDGETNASLRVGDEPASLSPERGAELLQARRDAVANGEVGKKPAKKATKKRAAKKRATKKATAEEAGGRRDQRHRHRARCRVRRRRKPPRRPPRSADPLRRMAQEVPGVAEAVVLGLRGGRAASRAGRS